MGKERKRSAPSLRIEQVSANEEIHTSTFYDMHGAATDSIKTSKDKNEQIHSKDVQILFEHLKIYSDMSRNT